jgi:type I restriction enzyme S subunit
MDNGKNYQFSIADYPLKTAPIACLGKVPSHWDAVLLGYLFTENREKNTSIGEDTILSLSYGKLIVKNGKENFGLLPASYETYQIINPGYIVFRFTDMQNDHVSLRVGHAQDKGIITSAYVGLKPRAEISTKYYYYLFHLLDILKFYYSFGGGVRQSLNYKGIRNLQLPLPPANEQNAIANFLDRKTAQIDEFIALKKQTIALLQEQKTALINRAVTQGLNPDVPVKDSGIEWLGEIPAHWEVIKLKFIGFIKYGLGQPPREKEGGLPIIRATNVERGKIVTKDLLFVDPEDVPYSRDPILREDDIIVVRSGAYTADSAIIPREFAGAVTGYDMVVRVDRKNNPGFVAFCLLADYALNKQLLLLSLRAAQPHLNKEELGNSFILLPPPSEQHQIVAHIKKAITKIDQAIAQAQQQIALIKEYRESLISQAVTGKIKVVDD